MAKDLNADEVDDAIERGRLKRHTDLPEDKDPSVTCLRRKQESCWVCVNGHTGCLWISPTDLCHCPNVDSTGPLHEDCEDADEVESIMEADEPLWGALLQWLNTPAPNGYGEDITYDEGAVTSYDEHVFDVGNMQFWIGDEDAADDLWDERLQSYLEECVLEELPENVRRYFDEAKWKEDAKVDGRGHAVSSYDGAEYDWLDFVIFRLN